MMQFKQPAKQSKQYANKLKHLYTDKGKLNPQKQDGKQKMQSNQK